MKTRKNLISVMLLASLILVGCGNDTSSKEFGNEFEVTTFPDGPFGERVIEELYSEELAWIMEELNNNSRHVSYEIDFIQDVGNGLTILIDRVGEEGNTSNSFYTFEFIERQSNRLINELPVKFIVQSGYESVFSAYGGEIIQDRWNVFGHRTN